MFCEKCGKKLSYKKSQCDSCKNPIEYEGFSKIEYETVARPEPVVSVVPKAENVTTAASQPKGFGKLIAIISAAVATVMIVTVGLVVMFISDGQTAGKPNITQTEAEPDSESYEVITKDAVIKVKFNGEDAEKYTYSVKKLSDEAAVIFEGDEKTKGKLCKEDEELVAGVSYEITVKGDGKITKDKEITKIVTVSEKEDDKDAKAETEFTLIGFTDEEIYTRDIFSKHEDKEYSYSFIDFDGDLKKELIIRENTKEYTIYRIDGYTAEKVKNGNFKTDEFYYNFGWEKFYTKNVNKPDNEKDDEYFKYILKDGKIIKEKLKAKPDDLGLPYMEFKQKTEPNGN